jgi:hypothetical protein
MVEKIFLTKSGKAEVLCPECGKTKLTDFERFRNINKKLKLKVTCKCSHAFSIILERREHVRHRVDLRGVLIANQETYNIKVFDISQRGMKIRTREVLDLNYYDKVVVEFILDDDRESMISKDAVIKQIDQKYIGVQFSSPNHFDMFGKYLWSQFS